jgi:hypothetical protein
MFRRSGGRLRRLYHPKMTDPAPPRPAVTRRQVLLGGSLLSVGLLAWGSSLDSPLAHSSPDTPNGTFGVTHTDAE